MEEFSYLKPIIVKMKCDKCGKGYMKRANDTVLFSNPPQYEHICENCAHIETYSKSYPYIEFVDSITEEKVNI